jgi:eukaryotic-like serine/threonine-protein kinase
VEAVWVDRNGRASPIDSGWAFIPAANNGFALSPDGTRLAIGIRNGNTDDVWIKQLDRGPLTRLTFQGNNIRPAWSHDSRSVYFIADTGRTNNAVLVRLADGAGSDRAVVDLARPIWDFVPLRDTAQILLRLGGPRDIVTMRPGRDTAFTALLADPRFDEVSPTVSPDGRWLAYASNESGRSEVYVRPWPDVNAGRWQVSRSGGVEPLWAHNGRELFYRNPGGDLISATVTPGPTFALGDQRILFAGGAYLQSGNLRGYAVSPDDSRFIFTRLVGSQTTGPVDLVLVENWFTELDGRR